MADTRSDAGVALLGNGSSLVGKNVLVTGGAGVVGSHIVDHLVHEGVGRIVVLDQLTQGRRENLAWALANGPVSVVEADIGDRAALADVMEGTDLVFHQAAISVTRCAEDPRLALEVIVDGTFNVVESAADAGVKKVVAASSASVYGAAEILPTPEDHHPYRNRTLYGAGKAFNEGVLRSFHDMRGLDYVALRYYNVYGPRMHSTVLNRWMDRIATGLPPLIDGDGTQTMDFVYIDDVARANILAARSAVTDEVFNVGSGVETSLNDLAEALSRVFASDLQAEHGPERAVNSIPRRVADTSKAERLLGFKAAVGLDEGLGRLVAWWREERMRLMQTVS